RSSMVVVSNPISANASTAASISRARVRSDLLVVPTTCTHCHRIDAHVKTRSCRSRRVAVRSVVMPTGPGTPDFQGAAVEGTLRHLETPDDVIALLDTGAEGVIALVREAGATFLAPIFHELAGVVCLNGTPRSHIGIVSREFHTPCLMAVIFDGGEPA